MKIQEKSESFCFSHKFPAFEAIIYRTGFLDIRYLLGLSIYLLISTRCRYSHGFGSLVITATTTNRSVELHSDATLPAP